MICPYCKKEIMNSADFCPECGQDITNITHQDQSDSYWKNVNRENIESFKTYNKLINEEKQQIRTRKNKTFIATALMLVLLIVGTLGVIKYWQYHTQMIDQVRVELVGKTMTAHDSHMEGLGFIYHEYWQLTFIDNGTLDYSYLKTIGPAEGDEQPKYQGTYSYTLSRSITGKFTIKVNGVTYRLKVNENNVPKSISR